MRMNGLRMLTGPRWPSFLLVLLATLVLAAPALAGQRIEFKNGQVLVVQRVRYEGDVAYLTLADGSEIGFPKALIKETKAGFKVTHPPFETHHSGRGPSANQLQGYKRILGEAGYPAKVVAKGVISGKQKKRISVGFRYKGSIDITQAAQGTGEAVPIWAGAQVAGGGQVVPPEGTTRASGRPVKRAAPNALGMPMQVQPKKNARDGLDVDPRKRWE